MKQPKHNLIQIQEEYINTVNAGIARWSHRPACYGIPGGHASRIFRGAHRKAQKQLKAWGFNEAQIKDIIQQANAMALLIRLSDIDE